MSGLFFIISSIFISSIVISISSFTSLWWFIMLSVPSWVFILWLVPTSVPSWSFIMSPAPFWIFIVSFIMSLALFWTFNVSFIMSSAPFWTFIVSSAIFIKTDEWNRYNAIASQVYDKYKWKREPQVPFDVILMLYRNVMLYKPIHLH